MDPVRSSLQGGSVATITLLVILVIADVLLAGTNLFVFATFTTLCAVGGHHTANPTSSCLQRLPRCVRSGGHHTANPVGGGSCGNIPPGRFRDCIDYVDETFEIVDVPTAVSNTDSKQVALTFDDGFKRQSVQTQLGGESKLGEPTTGVRTGSSPERCSYLPATATSLHGKMAPRRAQSHRTSIADRDRNEVDGLSR